MESTRRMAEYDEPSEGNAAAAAGRSLPSDARSQHDEQPHKERSSKSRERDREREEGKDRERDRGRGRDRERYWDRERGYERCDRNGDCDRHHRERREHRGRSDDHDYRRSRDRDSERRERDRDGHRRHRPRSRSKGQSKRVSGFDQGPSQTISIAAPSVTPGLLPAVPAAIPAMLPNMFNLPIAGQPQAMTQQATRHARRVYVGGLPPSANEQTVARYLNRVMAAIGGNAAGLGDAVVNVYINHDKKFAFVEMRSVEEASNAMALDEAQVRELLETFGPLRGFDIVKDRETGNSKGYAFCVYQDLTVTNIACAALNGIQLGDRTLTVRRANQGAAEPRPEHENILLQAQHQAQMKKLVYEVGGALPTKVVCLTQVVSEDDLRNDEEYKDILEDMTYEGRKYGNLVQAVIPRPHPSGVPVAGVGKVFLEYADVDGSTNAKAGMHGRRFDGKAVDAVFYPEKKFADGEYDG